MNGEVPASNLERRIPLCVDLDGSLSKTDLLWESLLASLRTRPWVLLQLPYWLVSGRAHVKARLAGLAAIDFSKLPYREDVIAMIRARKLCGDTVYLTTASNERLADGVAGTLQLFDGVIASDDSRNLKGRNKALVLVERFGRGGFDYIGDSHADRHVWCAAREAYVVGARTDTLLRRLAPEIKLRRVGNHTSVREKSAVPLIQALRLHQWVKNLLVCIPLVTSHRLAERAAVVDTLLAFLAFCLCASSAYVVNDLTDIESDRAHPHKHRRPFASGDLPVTSGFLLAGALLIGAATIAAMLPRDFGVVLIAYFVLTLAYSLYLKTRLGLDVVTLAALYTIRIIGGGNAAAIQVSSWLLAFAMFLFFSLALLKRYAELLTLGAERARHLPGRGYEADDRAAVLALGTAAGLVSVLVLAFYVNGEAATALYLTPAWLWLLCPLMLYWIARIWILTGRGIVHEDPVLFAARDRSSYVVLLLVMIVVWLATLG